ncbi:hypothetical protein J6590_106542, partial [Homalodisca vitripennis]
VRYGRLDSSADTGGMSMFAVQHSDPPISHCLQLHHPVRTHSAIAYKDEMNDFFISLEQ